jgi:hypothetical protein
MKTRTLYQFVVAVMATIALSLGGGEVYGQDSHGCGAISGCSGTDGTGNGACSFTAGSSAEATGDIAISIGYKANAAADSSLTFGNLLKTSSSEVSNMIIGFGVNPSNVLENGIENSIMIGVNSTIPTMYVEDAGGVGNLGRVGIGTTAPAGILHVDNQTADTDLIIEKDGNTAASLMFHNVGVESAKIELDTDETLIIEHEVSNEDITFEVNDGGTAGEEVMRLDASNQNVGIGTTAPAVRLHVAATAVAADDEPVARYTVDDDTYGFLQIENRSSVNGEFAPGIIGRGSSDNSEGLYIRGSFDPAEDTGGVPAMTFDVRLGNNTAITTRPLYRWRDQ